MTPAHPRSRSRRLTVVAVGALSAFALAGCAGAGPTPAETPDEPIDLTMSLWATNEDQLALFQGIADAYVAENPDLVSSITFESTPAADYTTALTTQIAGGDVPDLAWVFESSALEFVDSGALYDVAPTLQGTEGYEYDDLLDSSLALWTGGGDGLYAYPFSNSPFGMFVNTDLIAAAGQPNPSDLVASGDWTWDTAFEIGSAVATSTGKSGVVARDFDYQLWQFLTPVWGPYGAAPWNEDGTECTFTDPEMTDALTAIHDAIFTQGAMPGPGTTADFFAGEAAMTTTQISRASLLDDSFAWDLVPLPDGPDGHQNIIGQAGVGVMAGGAHPEIAAQFLAYFTNPENAEQLAAYFPPPRESLITTAVLGDANPKLTEDQLQQVVIDGIPGAVTLPSHKSFAEVQDVSRAQLDSLWTADADIDEVTAKVCDAIQPLLNR